MLEIIKGHAEILRKLKDIFNRYNITINNCNNNNSHNQLLFNSQIQSNLNSHNNSISISNNDLKNLNSAPKNLNSSMSINIPHTFMSHDESDYLEIIEDTEKLCKRAKEIMNNHIDVEFLQFSFYQIISQIYEDISTLKSLFISYESLLILDSINSISNMLCVRHYIENLKMKFSISNKSFYELKLYLFYIQLFLDTSHKINFLFKTYFDNKKINLLQCLESANFISDFKIKDELFSFRTDQYCDRYIKKCNEENIEISYFMIVFEKKKYLESFELDVKEMTIKNYYLSKNQMFLENDDELGLLSIFHTNGDPYKNILNEISNSYKNMSNETKNTYFSSKNKINLFKLNLYSISNYLFCAVKFKERNADTTTIPDICKDMRYRFSDMHIFKTLFL